MHIFCEGILTVRIPSVNLWPPPEGFTLTDPLLFHTIACFYVIYRYHVFSEWRSIRPVKINEYDIIMATHYDITIGNITRTNEWVITLWTSCALFLCRDISLILRNHEISLPKTIIYQLTMHFIAHAFQAKYPLQNNYEQHIFKGTFGKLL